MSNLVSWSGWMSIAMAIMACVMVAGAKACEGQGVEGSILGIVLLALAGNAVFVSFGCGMFWIGANLMRRSDSESAEDTEEG